MRIQGSSVLTVTDMGHYKRDSCVRRQSRGEINTATMAMRSRFAYTAYCKPLCRSNVLEIYEVKVADMK